MKSSDILWLDNLVAQSLEINNINGTAEKTNLIPGVTLLQQMTHLFLEEMSLLMLNYADHYNKSISRRFPNETLKVFRLGNPKPGMIALKGRDKLVVSCEGTRIRFRIVRILVQQELSQDVLEIETVARANGNIEWQCANDNQNVNPELVARNYLGAFILLGHKAFDVPHHPSRREYELSLDQASN